MIKFFRQIRYSLMEQNKTSKYLTYAIGEIILVVVGILIALQINNWNGNRKNGIKEQVILKSLRINLKENYKLLEQANQAALNAYNASLDLHELIQPNVTNINTNRVDSLLSISFDYFSFDANSGTINEIINSGQLNIIKNEALKNRISNWSGLLEDAQRDGDIANKHALDNMVMYIAKHGSLSNLPIANQILKDWNLRPKPPTSFEVDYQSLMSSSEFENLVSWHAVNMAYILNEYLSFQSYIENIIDLIDAEIEG
ncbi:hypothetical protein OE09_1008 [Flavobacteriaceae bacterium MAR_2010_72]|nr:hypothetical protein OE09_1008 [Flavobacteriaceae bacterium MAR_2010_72]TVZ60189.1 hypothetical protein NA63_2739 [Flavobacteriaceae bacterium MAR_2010_105]